MKSARETNKYAFVVLKPDAIRQFLDINIIQEVPKEGLEIIKHKMVKLTKEQVAAIYGEKLKENYYPFLEKFLTEEPSICLLLKSEADAMKVARI
ncbi:MAG: nucleoside-diphosphate kinase [Patescibacteria group bacterium]